ncbi:hypothetical protein [Achromobacter spanius]|uniref:hypothetical protein n=1 Tax=Achromobacter spanius TaxID=217203 RepID=UPI0037FF58A0
MTPAPASGLNALIEQCQRLEAALNAGKDPGTAASMHRFVAEMETEEGRAPPGAWSPLVLSVLVMAGGLGVGIELLSLLLRFVGPAMAAFALVAVCAGTALALSIGMVLMMAGRVQGVVLLKRVCIGLIVVGSFGGIAWTQGDVRAVGPVVAVLGGLGAWLVMNSSGFYVFVGYRVALRCLARRA